MKHLLLLSAAVVAFHFANAGVGFTENRGQFTDQTGKPADNVLFRSCGTGPGIFVTTTGLTYVFEQKRQELVHDRDEAVADKINWSAIHMTLVGATIRPENIITEDALPGVNNYYYAHCPQGILGVKSYHTITIKEIYPGIDWIISADDKNGVMHDFLVHANGNHSDIRMKYDGLTAPITINSERKLVLTSDYGTIYEGGLAVKRKDDGKTLTSYFNVSGNEVRYLIIRGGRPGHSFIIDPPLQWDTTMASSGLDYGSGVVACRDQSYDVLGCGYTDGVDFPVWNAQQGTISGQEDAVVYRLDASGNRIWSTYFGGTDIDNAKGIATDLNGNAYVIGHTASQDLPVMGSLQANYGGGVYDAFIAKYDWQGAMVWASWRGGTGTDFGTAITADDNGMCYAVGYTNTTVNFPLLNAIQPTKAGSAGVYDGFVMSFSATQTMQWSTYYGGTDEDKLRAVALDATGTNIVIAGNTVSGNFPTAGTPFQLLNAQPWSTSDAVIVKMTTGQSVVFASYCGGFEDDYAYGITTDDAGNIYATGVTNSSDFPTEYVPTAYNDTVLDAIMTADAFVIKCNPTGTTLLWSTYFGGMAPDYGYAIGYDQYVGVYICGNTASTDFPVMQPLDMNYYQATHGDGGNFNDAFIAWFNVNDQLSWSTFYGGMNSEEAYSLGVSLVGDVYLTGVDSNEIYMAKFNPGLPTNVVVICPSGLPVYAPYPNPASGSLSIGFFSTEGVTVIEVMDMSGRLIVRNEFVSAAGENRIAINIEELAKGSYTLKLSTPSASEIYPFVKE